MDCSAGSSILTFASIASLQLPLGDLFGSDRFITLRSMLRSRLSVSTPNLVSHFSRWQANSSPKCVQAALGVPQAVSKFVDTGTFLVSLGTQKIRSAPLMDYFRSCGIM